MGEVCCWELLLAGWLARVRRQRADARSNPDTGTEAKYLGMEVERAEHIADYAYLTDGLTSESCEMCEEGAAAGFG